MNYAPGLNDNRGALYLTGLLQSGRNMSEALTAAGGWLNNFLEQQKQINAAGKSADYFVKADPSALSQIGVHPDEWANMGARDKASAVQGLMQSRAGQQAAAQSAATAQLRLAQAARLGQTTQLTEEESQALPVLMQNLDQLNQANPGTPGTPGLPATTVPLPPGLRMLPGEGAGQAPPGLGGEMPPLPSGIAVPGVPGTAGTAPMMTPGMAALVHAAASMGATNPRLAASIARQVLPKLLEGGADTQGMSFEEDPVSGFRFATKGKIVQPSGVNPGKAQPQVLLQHDENGRILGVSQIDAKGHATFRNYNGPEVNQMVDEQTGEPIKGFYVGPGGKVIDERGMIQKLTGVAPTNAPGAKAPTASGAGEALTIDQAREFLKKAGGDKVKAQILAKSAGFTF